MGNDSLKEGRVINYYNDNDKAAVKWLKYLIGKNLIPKGYIDDRSIKDVNASDLSGFTQCHFFAGIAGWSYALQLAGWSADRPVWTASCPCQPFSVAGKGKAEKDERHLWPYLRRLIEESKPKHVFGEQVASKLGREWLAGVQVDLERMGFVFGAADICAAGVGAPHIRQRLWWIADRLADTQRHDRRANQQIGETKKRTFNRWPGSTDNRLADTKPTGSQGRVSRRQDKKRENINGRIRCNSAIIRMADSKVNRLQGREELEKRRLPWRNYRLADCRDGKQRRIPAESSFFPLAYGIPGRMALLRGIGNSIVPQVAAEFIKAYMEI